MLLHTIYSYITHNKLHNMHIKDKLKNQKTPAEKRKIIHSYYIKGALLALPLIAYMLYYSAQVHKIIQ